ncbi:MAG: asparagine synthetase B [Colwellia sp.]|nr:asparagine synthetase B [Colwellia sp.]
MCGIIGGWSKKVEVGINSLIHRGPDAQKVININGLFLGHTRLSILDLDPRSNQPFLYGKTTLIFNGEIWNYKQIRSELRKHGLEFVTTGDTEVLAAALDFWGVYALSKIDGMFAIAWTTKGSELFLARDKFGEIPLHIATQKPFYFASEKKALLSIGVHPKSITDVSPGYYCKVNRNSMSHHQYYDIPIKVATDSIDKASKKLYNLIGDGTSNRAISDVPVCTLLSGGIDSAAIAYFLKKSIPDLVAYTAVYNPKSKDLKMARVISKLLDIDLREIKIPCPSRHDLGQVINTIEMPHKAQVEIGWACLKLAETMKNDGFKVVFSGEGSDELWASYGFAYHSLLTQDWHQYRKELFLSQARKNFSRCNKIFMAHSIECRLPFLHYPLVEYAISLKKDSVQKGKSKPKAVIQDAFAGVLPDTITKRQKVAFQDGMGIKKAISRAIINPKRFYNAEYSNRFNRFNNTTR